MINGYLSKTLAKNSESLSDFKAKSVGTFIRDSIQVFNAPDKLPQKLLLFTILKFWQNGGDSVVLRDPQTTKDGIDSKKEFQLLPDLKTLPDLNSKILPNFKNNDFLKNNSISPNLGDEGNQGSVNDGNPPNFRGGGDGGSGNNNNPPNNLISEENFSNSGNSSNFPLKEREEQQNIESNTNQGMEQTNITIARSDLSQSYVFLKPPKFKISTVRTNNESINKVVDEGNKIIDNYNKLSNEHLDSARLEVQNQNNNQPIPYSGFMGDLENMSQENIPQENIDNDFTI